MQSYPHSRRGFLVAATNAVVGLALKPAFGKSQDLASLTRKEASELLRSKNASPVDLTQACLKRIQTYNSALNSFITVTRDQGIEAAGAMEAEQWQGTWRGPLLHGIPIALKDNIDTAGSRHALEQIWSFGGRESVFTLP
jgi:aspartyl-tRNA(Asn)/glutamyl-tRNA(Gln) amidotransferase subunit A